MSNRKVLEVDRVGRVARLEADNARLRRVARELEADLGGLRAALGLGRRYQVIDPAHRLLLVSGGERRDGEV
jgi:hypothetical protein